MKKLALKFDYQALVLMENTGEQFGYNEDILNSSSIKSILKDILKNAEGALYLHIEGILDSNCFRIKVSYSETLEFRSWDYISIEVDKKVSSKELEVISYGIYNSIEGLKSEYIRQMQELDDVVNKVHYNIYMLPFVRDVEIPENEDNEPDSY